MKDLPHHMKKLNRLVIRSTHREELDEEAYELTAPRKQTARQVKKQAKAKMAKERSSRTPSPLNPDERNKKMAKRVPVFDRTNNAKPRAAKPSKKKTPRI